MDLLAEDEPAEDHDPLTLPEQASNDTAKILRELDFLQTIYPKVRRSEDLLSWWRSKEQELPFLAAVGRRIFCGCATSVTSERIFSLSGHIVSKKRSSLKPELVNMLTCLAFNE